MSKTEVKQKVSTYLFYLILDLDLFQQCIENEALDTGQQ